MFLRSLQIRGFKSFADKTVLEFAPGVSVIVGPNGSGKSNLVDAISWVLGEQGPRALRGGQMADVIFAGSPARPQLGMAEVKLVIDNSAGLIPVPMSEIEISRTIFRSGESEYRIGGQTVRLLDVQELLAESGIGRALHTIVSQGELDTILSNRPEDRRQYVEEAAGIAKHRKRKERAERKLAGLDQDLLRLQDVLAELKRQLRPLKQQAEMAKRHEQLTAEADAISVRLAAARLRSLLTERDRRTGGWEEGLARRKQARERLDTLDDRVQEAADERARAVWVLQEAEGTLRGAQTTKSEAEATLRHAVEAESVARQAFAAEATRGVRLQTLEEDATRIRARLEEVAAELAQREAELEQAEIAFRQEQEHRREVDEERRRISEEAAAHRAEMETLRRSLAGQERDRGRLDEQLGDVRRRREAADAERDGLTVEIERLDAETAPLSERRSALERERHGLADRVAELEEAVRGHEHRRDVLRARLQDIEETPGSRFLAGHRGRAIGLLGGLVSAKEGWEAALDAGLGSIADAVVYLDGTEAVADARDGDGAILAIAGGGPASFVIPGERTLLSIVAADPSVRGLVCTVLRDIYLADTVEEAADKHARHPKAAFVTPEGVLVGPAVIRTTRRGDSRAAEIRRELAVVDHDLAQARAALRPRRERLEQIQREVTELAERIDGADADITRAAERLSRLETELASLGKEEEILGQRLAGMDDAAVSWRDRLAQAEPVTHELPELPRLAEPPIQARVAVETLRRDRAALESRLSAVRAERETLAAQDPAALQAAVEAAEAARTAAEEALAQAEAALDEATVLRNAAAASERAATEDEAGVNRAWREASTELERLREEYEDEDRVRGDLERRIRDAERLLREGHRRDPQEALTELSDEDTVESLEKRAELVQRRLGLLGRVNLLAGGEFEVLQERHDFLARELDDVRRAKRDLLEVIQRIESEITATFESAYRDVAAEFERLFKELFPGGEGRLVATEPGDLLNTGIEIEARPGRKRVKRISLLSGGERALTAMAFLFAIFRARPSPFYLMDEVEPALDDVNLHRFLKLLEGFVADSQVLIVTHQKRTMEVAGMMYGVSMSKDGTSKVVAQRLDEPGASAEVGVERLPEPIVVPEPDAVH
ncbi:MAG TPA: chromosome segregation protein SMC [Actinomycetota bacterium]|nr:chromosome segregation protein SMC [Actinomycetota bacterium]